MLCLHCSCHTISSYTPGFVLSIIFIWVIFLFAGRCQSLTVICFINMFFFPRAAQLQSCSWHRGVIKQRSVQWKSSSWYQLWDQTRCAELRSYIQSCYSNIWVFEFRTVESWNILAELSSRWLQMQGLLCISLHQEIACLSFLDLNVFIQRKGTTVSH